MTDQDQMRERAAPPDQDARPTYWLINFDDADRPNEVFTDEQSARETLAANQAGWNCTLFVEASYARRLEQEREAARLDAQHEEARGMERCGSMIGWKLRAEAAEQRAEEEGKRYVRAVLALHTAENENRSWCSQAQAALAILPAPGSPTIVEAARHAVETIADLRAAVDDARAPLEAELAQVRARLTEARKALWQYGDHDDHCPANNASACRCGFSKALAAADEPHPSTSTAGDVADALTPEDRALVDALKARLHKIIRDRVDASDASTNNPSGKESG